VLKATGVAHKSDAGGVLLGIGLGDLPAAAEQIAGDGYLVEEMVQGAVAEVLVGVTRDAAHGFVLTLGAGGVLTELWQDTVSLLLPSDDAAIRTALSRLRIFPLLTGYRGKPAANMDAVVDAVLAVQACVIAHADRIVEIEVNPLMCTSTNAIAADALMIMAPERNP
jgi:acetyl-CoA synthetase